MKLPIKEGHVHGADWWSMHRKTGKSVRLPSRIQTTHLHWNAVFHAARLYCIYGINTMSFGKSLVSLNSMFSGAIFSGDSPFSFEIENSNIVVGSMFYCTSGLFKVTFKNCNLHGLRDLFVRSDVETVMFDTCSIELDEDSINDYVGCGSEVFSHKMTKLIVKNCDSAFITTIVGMFDNIDGFENLEIEILD